MAASRLFDRTMRAPVANDIADESARLQALPRIIDDQRLPDESCGTVASVSQPRPAKDA